MKSFTLVIGSVDELMAANRDLIAELAALLPVDDVKRRGLLEHEISPVRNLARMCGPIPASEDHHDSVSGGLFRHSLLATVIGLKTFHSKNDPTTKDFVRLAIITFMACLCHDIGKLFFVDVSANGKRWNPTKEYVLDYFQRGTHVTCIFKYGRGRTGHTGHEALGLYLINQIIPLPMLSWIGLTQANNLLATLSHTLDTVLDDVRFYMEQGDRGATAAVLTKVTKQEPIKLQFGAHRADEFVLGFQALATSGRLRPNVHDGNVFISSTHTVIPIQDKGRIPGILRQVYEYNRNQALAGSYGSQATFFYKSGDPTTYLDEISARCRALGAGAWCLVDPQTPADKVPEIRHYWTLYMARGGSTSTRRGSVLVFRNHALWGGVDPAHGFGVCRSPMVFMTNDSRQLSLDPEDLGFQPADARVVQVAANRSQGKRSPDEDRIQSLLDAAVQLWATCDRLTPITGETPRHQMLRRLDGQVRELRGPASSEFIHEVVVSAVDRLRDYAARTERGEVVPQGSVTPDQTPMDLSGDLSPEPSDAEDIGAIILATFQVIWGLPQLSESSVPTTTTRVVFRHGDRYLIPWPHVFHAVVGTERTAPYDPDQLEDEFAHCMRMPAVIDKLGIVTHGEHGVGFLHRLQLTVGVAAIPVGRYLVIDRTKLQRPATAMKPLPDLMCVLVSAVTNVV